MSVKRGQRFAILVCMTGLLVSGAALWEPSVAALPPTCCAYANECSGNYDICCDSNCGPGGGGKQCQPCKNAGCSC
jgi:hypothetical protein